MESKSARENSPESGVPGASPAKLPIILNTHLKNEALILYVGQTARVVCDRNCRKAWGNNNRPRVQLSSDPDDFAYLTDVELGEAPVDPGTYEGGCAKPRSPDEFPQKWCVRECERSAMSMPGEWPEPLDVPTFTEREYNMPHLHPEAPAHD